MYIKHLSNARQDERRLALRMKLGWEGYGLYWGIVEILSASANYECVKDYNRIAFDLRVGADIVKSLVEDFGLFTFTDDGERFYSEVLSEDNTLSNLQELAESTSEAVEGITDYLSKLEREVQELKVCLKQNEANGQANSSKNEANSSKNEANSKQNEANFKQIPSKTDEAKSKQNEANPELSKKRAEAGRKGGLASARVRKEVKQNEAKRQANFKQNKKQEKAPLCSPFPLPPVTPNSIPPIIPQKEVCDKGAREDFGGTAESESSAEPKQEASACADILPPPTPPVESSKRTIFTPPTEEEVAEYAEAKGYADFETERFVDFYASKGWYVGKNKMKDWRAAVRNWWRSQKDRNNRTNQTSNGTDKYANRRGCEGRVASAESFANWDGKF